MPKIYTKNGDNGETGLLYGSRVLKNDLKIECFGEIDELNSWIGKVICELKQADPNNEVLVHLKNIQSDLFTLSSMIISNGAENIPHLKESVVIELEKAIDYFDEKLNPLQNFILPGGCIHSCNLHIARTITRRAERRIVSLNQDDSVPLISLRYINRLSDFLFVLARYLNKSFNIEDEIWKL
jgi:cob(I)alamin adenosyltransferase